MSKIKSKPKILCLIPHYLPGFKSGGPVRSISNLASNLNDDFEFLIITSDRDILDSKPYENLKIDDWNLVMSSWVYYIPKSRFNFINIVNLIKKTNYDILYLNSFFSLKFTIIPLFFKKFIYVSNLPCVIAPRGEFSVGALKIKKWKKYFFLKTSKFLRLYKHLNWQASSEFELKDIQNNVTYKDLKIKIAPDLPLKITNFEHIDLRSSIKKNDYLKIVFFSRISPMKNLDFLLRVLQSINLKIEFSIYGPIEDIEYWNMCKKLINKLPTNIKVKYFGEIKPDNVIPTLALYDLFILPTKGENFGHVIIESLIAGTPVIISENTKWSLEETQSIKIIELNNFEKWTKTIKEWYDFDENTINLMKKSAKKFAISYLDNDIEIMNNKSLFSSFIK